MRTSSYSERDEEARFWLSVRSSFGCWIWRGPVDGKGYGKFVSGRKHYIASRFSYVLHFGPIESRHLLVCHRCDNRLCVNPRHLFLGTARQNTHDMVAKQRHCYGELNPAAKLTRVEVQDIIARRSRGEALQSIASGFGVSFQHVSLIARRKAWEHLG